MPAKVLPTRLPSEIMRAAELAHSKIIRLFPIDPGEAKGIQRAYAILIIDNVVRHDNSVLLATLSQRIGAVLPDPELHIPAVLEILIKYGVLRNENDTLSLKSVHGLSCMRVDPSDPDPGEEILIAV